MKTQFDELWSKINYTDQYKKDEILFWYLGDNKLENLSLTDIDMKDGKALWIEKRIDDELKLVYIPIYNILVVTHGTIIILDRRSGYQGKHNTDLPSLLGLFKNEWAY